MQLAENCVTQGYAGIGIAPISSVNCNAPTTEATKKGIYVVNIDEKMDMKDLIGRGGAVQGFVSTDNVKVGNVAAGYIVKLLGQGKFDVAIVEGKAGNASGEDRKNGADQAFKAAGYNIVASQPADWDRTKAYDLANAYMDRFPNLKAIYACNDTMAMGVEEAVKKSGKKILVVGTDGNPDAIASVKAGDLTATVAQDTHAIGAEAFQMLVDAVTNKVKIDPSATVPTKGVAPQLITK
jgi:D-allose transport system substrate-binding protein